LSNTLSQAGFNLVSLANNHSLDCGVDGLKETIEVLTHMGVTPILGEPSIREVKGLKIGAVAFNLVDGNPSSVSLVEAVSELKEVSDIVIVSLHWGREYKLSPSKKQLKLAHELIDAGADLILGHHPHRVQGIGSYKKGIVAYSLGNFVFDQRDELGKESIILLIRLKRNLVKRITIIPVVIIDYRPERASRAVGEKILNRLIEQSAQLNTHILKIQWNGMVSGRIYPFQDEIDPKEEVLWSKNSMEKRERF